MTWRSLNPCSGGSVATSRSTYAIELLPLGYHPPQQWSSYTSFCCFKFEYCQKSPLLMGNASVHGCSAIQLHVMKLKWNQVCCSVLQCVPFIAAVQYNYTWWCWSEAECVAVCCSVVQCVAVCLVHGCSIHEMKLKWSNSRVLLNQDGSDLESIFTQMFCYAMLNSCKNLLSQGPPPPTHTHTYIHIGTSITCIQRYKHTIIRWFI